jgi:hypothetical protein
MRFGVKMRGPRAYILPIAKNCGPTKNDSRWLLKLGISREMAESIRSGELVTIATRIA